jgi:hypothetical protein
VSFATITLCVASQVFIVVSIYFVMTQSGNVWIHPHTISILDSFMCLCVQDSVQI